MAQRPTAPTLVVAMMLLIGACGGNDNLSFGDQTPVEVATVLIESEAMAQRLGLGQLSGTECTSPAEQLVGSTFPCSADSDGGIVDFTVVLDGDDELFASPTNVVASRDVDGLEGDAVRALNRSNNFDFPADAIECGDQSVVLDRSQRMACVLTDPATNASFDAVITITNIEVLSFEVEITGER